MNIGGRAIGAGEPVYVIAEIGVNHDGSVERALDLTDAAAAAGADAVKLQYFETDRLMSKAAKLAAYQRAAGETDPIEMLRRLELSLDECAQVIGRAHDRGLHAIVTLFSLETVDAGLALPWDAIKTASPDVVNRPLLEALAADGRPIVVSTGAANWNEVQFAYHDCGLDRISDRLALMQCVSCYPTPREFAAIGGMLGLDAECVYRGGAIGYSDHTSDVDTGALATRAGACILEKHLTYDRAAAGPDHAASLDARSLAVYIERARAAQPTLSMEAYSARFLDEDGLRGLAADLADPTYGIEAGRQADGSIDWLALKRVQRVERDVRAVSRQSVVATRAIRAGEVLTRDMLTVKRPCDGTMPAADLAVIVGQRCLVDVGVDDPLAVDAAPMDLPGRVSVAEVEPAG